MIPIFSNTLGSEELDAVSEVFTSHWLGKGRHCDAFEEEFAGHLGVSSSRVMLFNNCTAAIYAGLRSLDIGPGDEVIVSTVNFVACGGAVSELGATPVFADVNPRTLNILPSEIDRLTTNRTRAVLILHYGGHPCPMDDIRAVCPDSVDLIEDSANSVSSTYRGQMCGTFGSAGVWSFDAMKTLVMSDGGALFIRDPEKRRRAESIRYLGLAPKTTSGMDAMAEKSSRWWEYDLVTASGRFISNDVMAAIGRVQLEKLPGFISKRREIWDFYQRELTDIPGVSCPPEPLKHTESSYYLYWIQTKTKRDELATFLADNGVYTTFRYFPLHLVDYFDSSDRLPLAESVNETTLNLPIHQNLTDGELDKIVSLIKEFFNKPAKV